MRAVFECLGIKDVVSKSLGTNNPYNMILATFEALKNMNSPKNVADRRSKHVSEVIKRRNVIINNNPSVVSDSNDEKEVSLEEKDNSNIVENIEIVAKNVIEE